MGGCADGRCRGRRRGRGKSSGEGFGRLWSLRRGCKGSGGDDERRGGGGEDLLDVFCFFVRSLAWRWRL